ncbi:MAG: 16S rRNA (cytosine(1402)-N(4))-methyltransferase RsmH, partial [Bacteroidota bacterium]|nr:16S rRNA (cytosine(1402)-N(4))-methyltransferase RsmH [Bacteroidota bacterium]
MDNYHIPVMLEEAVDALHIQENGIYVDATFGGGGHSRAILSRLGSKGRLIAFDQDPDAKLNADMLSDDRLLFIPRNFRFIQSFLNYFEIGQVDGVLADLGVSSHQFDEGTRGFSTRFDGPLDMRMNYNRGKTAKDILSESTPEDLLNMFSSYGEVRNAKELVKRLQAHPSIGSIETTQDFNAWIEPVIRGPREKYLAQVYQALRIAVNEELSSLTDF